MRQDCLPRSLTHLAIVLVILLFGANGADKVPGDSGKKGG